MLGMGCVFVIIGGAAQAATYHIAQIMLIRVITGIGTGLISSTVPVWTSEISSPKRRGRTIAIELSVILSGNVTVYWIDYGMSFVDTSAAFRFPLAFQCIYVVLALVLFAGLPEPPRLLYLWGQIEEADRVLCRLHGIEGSPESHEVANLEKTEILAGIRIEQEQNADTVMLKDIFWDNSPLRNRRRVFIVVTMQALQQLGTLPIPP